MRKIFCLLFLFLNIVYAHDYWLQPVKFHLAKGETLAVHLFVGDKLVPELERPLQKWITKKFELFGQDRYVNILAQASDSSFPVLKMPVDFDGLALIAMERDYAFIELTKEQFLEYLKHEEMKDVYKVWKKSEKQEKERERYKRFIKSLVKVGNADTGDLYKKVLGQKLEIVLLENPYLKAKGDDIKVQILFDGKPLQNKTVTAYCKNSDGNVFEYKARTNSKGIAQFKLNHSGFWLVRLVHLRQCKNCEDANWESFWASYSFWVK